MKVYSNGKKAAVIVLHQMFMIMMITCVYAIDYYIRVSSENMLCNFLTFAIVGLILFVFISLGILFDITAKIRGYIRKHLLKHIRRLLFNPLHPLPVTVGGSGAVEVGLCVGGVNAR